MHGFHSGCTFLVNAEVDSMGGVVDSGGGIGTKPSPCRAAMEKAQAELRLEYDVREERRRELEFLEKGGDPLDFKFGDAASVSVQSTSHTDQHPYQNLASEAKGSFAPTASAHGDSFESNGRLGLTIACEPNSADNFDGENEILQNARKSTRSRRGCIPPSDHSSQLDRSRIVKDSEDSPTFHPKKGQAYRRRNRSRTIRDASRSSFDDMASREGNGCSIPSRQETLFKPVASENQFETELDGTRVMDSRTSRVAELTEGRLILSNSKEKLEETENLSLQVDQAPATIKIEPAIIVGRDNIDILNVEFHPSSGAEITEDNATFAQLNETSTVNGDDKCTPPTALINNALVMTKGLDSESSCSQTNVSLEGNVNENGNGNGNGNVDSELCTALKNVDSNGAPQTHTIPVRENSVNIDDKMPSEDHLTNAMETASCIKEDRGLAEDCAEVDRGESSLQDKAKGLCNVEGQEKHDGADIVSEKVLDQIANCVPKTESSCLVRPPPVGLVSNELSRNAVVEPSSVLYSQPCTENQPKSLDKAQEDRILEEARMIEAKRKRIAELSVGLLPREDRHKCHWDLVLEEMAWLANDFAQERLWKMTSAAQICRRIAFASRMRLEERSKYSKQKSVAHTLSKAVMDFWLSARLSVENADSSKLEKCKHEAASGGRDMDLGSRDGLKSSRRKQDHAIYGYAVRFLQFNCSLKPFVEVDLPGVTDETCDIDLPEVSWQDQFTEDNLFYAVPPGAIETYRNLIESCLAECERIGNNVQDEVVTTAHDAAEECLREDNDYEEDEGDNLYYQPRELDTGKPSKKKRKNIKLHGARSYEFGGDFGYGHCAETRNGTAQLNVIGKRPVNNLYVDPNPIPTKRIRTASRPRFVVPFGAGPAGVTPVLSKGDASSEDTNSFMDDQSFLHGGSVAARGSEVDSTMNFKKQSVFDSVDMSAKPKKKKKIKHQTLSYDQRWQLDSSMQDEQNDLVRKRLDNHQLESNGNGLFGQHAKKPKLAKHSLDNSFDNTAPVSGSIASPVASQMSNFSSQTKVIKFIGGRDRGKKGKGLKVSIGQLGSGSPWTIVEDQALVVLVHDMGPNWELVSDAINSILQFKCIFRKPQECKERHKFLMDRPSGDGADSAEDSGSSQPYPSTLPGIPKGSARQLFKSLHAHVEEDNIKSRFEKIIRIEQQLHKRKKKNDNQDFRQIAPAHGSHILSLSQVIPNNVNGGVLTPLDLCNTVTSNQDPLSLEYQSSHAGGLPLANQSGISPMHPPSGLNSSLQGLQGSPGMGIANNLASPPSQFTGTRDARYSVPRSGSLAIEEQQRLHQYNSVLPGRNVQASNPPSSGSLSGSDRGVRMHPGANGVSLIPGLSRSIPMARPAVHGIPPSTMNSGSVLASNIGGMSSNMNVHSGTASSHGNAMFRHHDNLHGVRSGQSSEHQRQMVLPEIQMQATQTNSAGFSNNHTPPLQTYPGHHHPHALNSPHPHLSTSNHGATPEQQAYIRIPNKQMQQRLLQQRQHQQHPAASSGAMMTHVHAASQLPVSSPSQPVSLPSLTPSSPITHVGPVPHQQLKNMQVLGRSAQSGPSGTINQGVKNRQRQAQEYQQSSRQHPQKRQQPQSQQAPKLMKAVGRGNMVINQNLPIDPSHLNVINSANSATQPQEPSVNIRPPASKPVQQTSSYLDGGNQGQALGSNQGPSSTVVLTRNHQQLQRQPSLKVVNQSQPALQRTSKQNRQVNSDSLAKSQVNNILTEQKALSVVPPPACGDSASNFVKKIQEYVCDSAMTSNSSSSGPSTSQVVMNSLSNKPLSSVNQVLAEKQSSGNNLVSHGLEAQWQQQESQPPPLQPILPQKQSQIQGGQSVTFTGTTHSISD